MSSHRNNSAFSKGYYLNGENHGFNPGDLPWESPAQQDSLRDKWNDVKSICGDVSSVLFIGCAFGNEVRYFSERRKQCEGVDISEFAIGMAELQVPGKCRLYNGKDLPMFADQSFDLVAAFDCMVLVDEGDRARLISEMGRISSRFVLFRSQIAAAGVIMEGLDGVPYKHRNLEYWSEMFQTNAKCEHHKSMMWEKGYHGIFCFKK